MAPPKAIPLELRGGPREIPNGYTTRRIPRDEMRWLLSGAYAPRPGDLVLARVEALGHHTRLQRPNGRRRQLFAGDEIVVAYADRYAPQQFEARVPGDLGLCHLVAAGGVASTVLSQHARIRRGATRLRPLGLIGTEPDGAPINVRDFALPAPKRAWSGSVPTLAIVGTAMDSGKTTTAAYLARGLTQYGLRVGYAKVTGTGAAGDPYLVIDAGANPVLDFTDVGFASTYRISAQELEQAFRSLLAHLEQADVDTILIEVADGLFQEETSRLLESGYFATHIHGLLFAAGDAMGAMAGAQWLQSRGHPLHGITGALEAAPLQVSEAQAATRLPVFGRDELADPHIAAELLDGLRSSVRCCS